MKTTLTLEMCALMNSGYSHTDPRKARERSEVQSESIWRETAESGDSFPMDGTGREQSGQHGT